MKRESVKRQSQVSINQAARTLSSFTVVFVKFMAMNVYIYKPLTQLVVVTTTLAFNLAASYFALPHLSGIPKIPPQNIYLPSIAKLSPFNLPFAHEIN